MRGSRRIGRLAASLAAFLALSAAEAASLEAGLDDANPTCPKSPNWSTYRQMRFTFEEHGGRRILRAEGMIDEAAPERLKEALAANEPIEEIWLRSSGGNARAGNAAGKIVREAGIPTRIPEGWACFSACNFIFMGGPVRYVDGGGQFIVHMFSHVQDKQAIRTELASGGDKALGLIGAVEQDSALLASEDNDFLIRMGVSRKLLTEVMYRQKALAEQGEDRSTRRCLTADEVARYNVANAR
jgi:hypothetical protein